MGRGVRMAAALGGLAAGGAAAAAAIGSWAWDRATTRLVQQLARRGSPVAGLVVTPDLWEELPAPVARYFEFALTPGQPYVARARIQQAGEFRTGTGAGWSALSAVQYYTTSCPGFVWDARIRMAPLVTARVCDSYIEGRAAMLVKVASLAKLVDEHDRRELDEGALHRYLAEAPWFPTALLPGSGVSWSVVDDSAAVATLTDGPNSVSLEFRFGTSGEIVSARTAGRNRSVQGEYVPTPWECSYGEYARIGSMRVPHEAEVAWILPEGRRPYFRGRALDISHDFAGDGGWERCSERVR